MAVYLVTYDLNLEKKRPDILKDVRKGSWAQLSESSYAIDTMETVYQVNDRLSKYIDSNDNLLVIPLTGPYAGQADKDVIDWLSARI